MVGCCALSIQALNFQRQLILLELHCSSWSFSITLWSTSFTAEKSTERYGWHFTFLSADKDAFAEAREMEMAASSAASFSKNKVAAAYSATNAKLYRMRTQTLDCMPVANEFTVQERKDMH